jgi:hypothetical protein
VAEHLRSDGRVLDRERRRCLRLGSGGFALPADGTLSRVEWWQSLGVGVLVGSVLGPLVRPWSRRVERHCGFDLGLTVLRVTVTAQTDATVVMETPIVRGTTQDVPAGVGVLWPAPGGADISPRRYAIQLDSGSYPATVTFVEQDPGFDQPQLPPSWTLAAGEVEQLHIWASAEAGGMHEWTMQLPLLVDGRREFVDVDKDGRPFVTVGRRHGYRDLCWRSEQWIDPPDWATPR